MAARTDLEPRGKRGATLIATGLLAGVALAACGGTATTPTAQHSTTTASATPTAASPTSITMPPPSTAPPAAASPSGHCDASDLQVVYLPAFTGGITEITYFGFEVVNTGSHACATGGYPGVGVYAADGSSLGTQDTRDSFGAPVRPIDLAPGAKASFVVGLQGDRQGACHDVGSVRVIPPDTTQSVTVPGQASTDGGNPGARQITACGPVATVVVGPLEPGLNQLLHGMPPPTGL